MVFVQPATAGFFPLDEELALLPGQLTPHLQEGLVRLSTHIPSFAKAATEFAYWTNVEVARSTARRLTEAAGASAVAFQSAQAEHIIKEAPPAPFAGEQVVFSVDGAMVPLLHGQWAEVRTLAVACITTEQQADGSTHSSTNELSYFSRLTDSASFSTLATLELHQRGVEHASQVACVVDGAEWCQSFIDLHAPQATRILDFAHAAEYVTAICQTVREDGALYTEAQRERLLHTLKHDGAESVLAELRSLISTHPAPAELPKYLAYLEKREAQMQYGEFAAQGWPLGSGMVESANKLVVEERLKGPGMHWSQEQVNPMLALRNAICSDRWAEVWRQIEHDQRCEERHRRRERQQQRQVAHTQCSTKVSVQAVETAVATPQQQLAARPPVSPNRSTATHPWRKPWSVRRQRELAATA